MNFDNIWSAYKNQLKAFLHTKISNPADVDDLLQEILLKTHRNIRKLNDEGSIKSWLFQIANRTVIDFYRKNNRFNEIDVEALWYDKSDTDVLAELSKCLEPFILELPEEMGALLKAIDIDGKSQKAYAEEIGISYSTLKSRVQKSRKALRTLFNECCHFQLDQHGNPIDFDPKKNLCKNC